MAKGGFFQLYGSGTDTIPVNFMGSPGEGVRVYTLREMEEMRGSNISTTYGNTTHRTNSNETFYNKNNIIINNDSNMSDRELADRIVRIIRDNKQGVVTEMSRQYEKRA
jgi:hypothetical protein